MFYLQTAWTISNSLNAASFPASGLCFASPSVWEVPGQLPLALLATFYDGLPWPCLWVPDKLLGTLWTPWCIAPTSQKAFLRVCRSLPSLWITSHNGSAVSLEQGLATGCSQALAHSGQWLTTGSCDKTRIKWGEIMRHLPQVQNVRSANKLSSKDNILKQFF